MDEKAQSTKETQWLHNISVYYIFLHVLVFVFCVLLKSSPEALNAIRRFVYFFVILKLGVELTFLFLYVLNKI